MLGSLLLIEEWTKKSFRVKHFDQDDCKFLFQAFKHFGKLLLSLAMTAVCGHKFSDNDHYS